MKRVLAVFLILGFTLWIMPLGSFIKPGQEKLACDGQRAMCMCHVFMAKADKALESGINLKAAAPGKANNASSGSYFIVSQVAPLNSIRTTDFQDRHFSYQNPFPALLESVPKI